MKRYTPLLTAIMLLIILFGTLYVVVQQSQRNDANYPQIQLAEDTAVGLTEVQPIPSITGHINMNQSLAPFTIVYTLSGSPIMGNGYLDGKLPIPPLHILQAATGKDYSAVTWQPEGNIRIAAVAVATKDYYVLSGRSLAEVEKNENKTFWLSFAGGVASLVVLTAGYALSTRGKRS